jgi:hypothetical protein
VLSRASGVSISSVACSIGVKISTLHGWVKAMGDKDFIVPLTSEGIEKSPCSWNAQEKLEALINAPKLSQEDLGEYCRRQGIFPYHLERWKAEFIESQGLSKRDNDNSEVKSLKNEVKSLTAELNRKEKALAEAAALLILKKKAQSLWNLGGED